MMQRMDLENPQWGLKKKNRNRLYPDEYGIIVKNVEVLDHFRTSSDHHLFIAKLKLMDRNLYARW